MMNERVLDNEDIDMSVDEDDSSDSGTDSEEGSSDDTDSDDSESSIKTIYGVGMTDEAWNMPRVCDMNFKIDKNDVVSYLFFVLLNIIHTKNLL